MGALHVRQEGSDPWITLGAMCARCIGGAACSRPRGSSGGGGWRSDASACAVCSQGGSVGVGLLASARAARSRSRTKLGGGGACVGLRCAVARGERWGWAGSATIEVMGRTCGPGRSLGRGGACVAQEGGGGTDSTHTVVRGGEPNNQHEVRGGGNNHVIGWWEGGLFNQIFK